MAGPLDGVRVIELGQLLAGPYCGQLLADYGAEVIKVEAPGVGDPFRNWGQELSGGEPLWWPIVARNKKSITLNLREPRGQEIVRRLVAEADIIIENFRPGTMEKWGLGFDELKAVNPKLIMVRVSGYGQTGPYSQRPGYASVGEAMGGLRYVIGDPSTPPSRAGISLGDTLTAMFACLGALAAMEHVRRTGEGQVVDAAIYESVMAVMESMLPEYVIADHIRERTGSYLPNVAPSNIYPTNDGQMVLMAANQDSLFRRLCVAMNQPELADDERYANHVARGQHQQELDAHISTWTVTMSADELVAVLQHHEVVVGKIYRAPELLSDPHVAARNSIVTMPHPRLGDFPMQNVVPRWSATPATINWVGPDLGEHTNDVLEGLLHMTSDDVAQLRDDGVV
jgi:formyl-CoA transferase